MNLLDMIKGAFKAPANTQNYRKEFGDWTIRQQIEGGQSMDFDAWMKKYYPHIPYVPGGGPEKKAMSGQDLTFLG